MLFALLAQLPTDTIDPAAALELVNSIINAVKAGNTTLAVVLVSIAVTKLVRAYGARFLPVLADPGPRGDRANYVLAFATGLATELAFMLGTGAPLSVSTVASALLGALASIGAHQAKKLKKAAEEAGQVEAAKVTTDQQALDVLNAPSGRGPQP